MATPQSLSLWVRRPHHCNPFNAPQRQAGATAITVHPTLPGLNHFNQWLRRCHRWLHQFCSCTSEDSDKFTVGVSENGVYTPYFHGIAMKMLIIQWINPGDMSHYDSGFWHGWLNGPSLGMTKLASTIDSVEKLSGELGQPFFLLPILRNLPINSCWLPISQYHGKFMVSKRWNVYSVFEMMCVFNTMIS